MKEISQLAFVFMLLLFSLSHTEVTEFWALLFQHVFGFFNWFCLQQQEMSSFFVQKKGTQAFDLWSPFTVSMQGFLFWFYFHIQNWTTRILFCFFCLGFCPGFVYNKTSSLLVNFLFIQVLQSNCTFLNLAECFSDTALSGSDNGSKGMQKRPRFKLFAMAAEVTDKFSTCHK